MFVMVFLVMFYVFVLGETYMEGLKHVKVYIYIGKVRVWLPKDPTRSPHGGPKGCRDTALVVLIDGDKGHLVSSLTPRRWGGVARNLAWWRLECQVPNPNDDFQYDPSMDLLGVDGCVYECCVKLPCTLSYSPHVLTLTLQKFKTFSRSQHEGHQV